MDVAGSSAFLVSLSTDLSKLFGCPYHTRPSSCSKRAETHHRRYRRARTRMAVRTSTTQGGSARARTRIVKLDDGGVIKVHLYGPQAEAADTRDVLLIHDFMTDKRLFRRFAKEKAFSGCRLIVPDLRGFGTSTAPKTEYSRSTDLENVVHSVRKGIGVDVAGAVDVIGSGMGGAVALQMGLDKQDLVRSITVLSSGMPGHSWSSDSLMLDISTSRMAGKLLEGMTESQKQNKSMSAAISEDATDLVRWKRDFIGVNKATWGVLLKEGKKSIVKELLQMAKDYQGFHFFYRDPVIPEPLDGNPLIDQLAQITQPVQVLVGDLDSPDFRQIAYEIWERVPNRRDVFRLENAGHFLTLEQPSVVAQQVRSFWQAHAPVR